MRKKTGYIQNRGTSWRIAYYDSSHTRQFESFATEEEAARELARRLADVAAGVPVSSKPNTVLFGELCVDVVNDYKVNKRASLSDLNARYKHHISPAFGKRKAASITTAHLNAYVVKRQTEGAADGTVNRELQVIRHTFKLALESGRILRMPKIPIVRENNVRTGFFTPEEVERLCSHLPKPLDSFVRFAFLTGWRYSEIVGLKWSNVDFAAGEIRLDPGTTKNREGRVFPMTADLRSLLTALTLGSKANVAKNSGEMPTPKVSAFRAEQVFVIKNRPIGQFRKTWKRANHKAGLPCIYAADGKKLIRAVRIFHDLRRSAAKELIRQGIPEAVVMKMCGWKTRSVFDRYSVVGKADLDIARDILNGARNGARAGGGNTGS